MKRLAFDPRSDAAAKLAAWGAYGRALIAALPPVDEEVERRVSRALAALQAKRPKGKILKQRVKP